MLPNLCTMHWDSMLTQLCELAVAQMVQIVQHVESD